MNRWGRTIAFTAGCALCGIPLGFWAGMILEQTGFTVGIGISCGPILGALVGLMLGLRTDPPKVDRRFHGNRSRFLAETGGRKRWTWLGIWCARIALCVCIGAAGGFWIAVAIGHFLVQGMPGTVAAYSFFFCAVGGGMAGAASGLVFGLLYAVTQAIAAYYRSQRSQIQFQGHEEAMQRVQLDFGDGANPQGIFQGDRVGRITSDFAEKNPRPPEST